MLLKERSKKDTILMKAPNNKLPEAPLDNNEEGEEEEEPPQPVSSDSELEHDDDDVKTTQKGPQATTKPSFSAGISRLFAPYRTLGVVSSAHPFALIPHQSSQSAMLCVPTDERFQLWQTDKLQPVMVSRAVPSVLSHSKNYSINKKTNFITHCVPDATLRATVVAHDGKCVTLYQRTAPVETLRVTSSRKIQNLLHLGRIQVKMTGEKEGQTENGAVIAVVLAKESNDVETDGDNEEDKLPVIKDDDDIDSSSESESDDSSVESSGSDEADDSSIGQVVVLIATRTTLRVHRRIALSDVPSFRPVTAVHPSTYVNKIVLAGSDEGHPAMCLLNIRSKKLIHVFTGCFPRSSSSSLSSSSPSGCITTLEQSPAIDTIAVGTDNGLVHLVNLRHDKKLFTLKHKGLDGQTVGVTSISFRNDGSAMKYGIAPMAVGRADGTITIWDLTPPEDKDAGRTLLCQMDHVHPGGVSKLQYMPQEPLLISTGTMSNSILMHIFDNPDHSGRLLRQRKGHMAPPSWIRYLHPGGSGGGVLANTVDGTDPSACQILSSGGPDRTLRVFSTARTVLDKEYSQGPGLEKKARKFGLDSTAELLLPPLTSMALCETRSRDWGDLVTIHEKHSFAYVWSTRRGAQSGPLLRQPEWNISAMKRPPPADTHATSLTMSACGNFAMVGTRGGVIYRYNVQSGNPRGSYPRDATEKEEKKQTKARIIGDVVRTTKELEKKLNVNNTRASNLDQRDADLQSELRREKALRAKLRSASHRGFAVTGMAVDSVNKTLISVGADAKLILWNFSTHAPHKKSPCTLPSPATKLSHVRDSDLAAMALEDFSVVMFDCAALTVVRRFGGGNACHEGPITDLGFSPDGRNLFTSSLDSTIRVWDVPTNTCIDWLKFKTPPTSLTVSPTGEFLATVHAGQIGINIWSDRSYYQRVQTSGVGLVYPICMDDPVPVAEGHGLAEQEELELRDSVTKASTQANPEEATGTIATAKEAGLVTLSGLPPAHWKNLFHLELVKERNRPSEAPQKPPSAPFFLQWRSGESMTVERSGAEADDQKDFGDDEWASAWSDDDNNNEAENEVVEESAEATFKRPAEAEIEGAAKTEKRRKVSHYRSQLASLLIECAGGRTKEGRRFQAVSDHVAKLGPSAVDVALSTLCNGMHDLGDGLPLLLLAARWLLEACESHERHEAINAYLHRFLYLHASVIAGVDATMSAAAQKIEDSTDNDSRRKEVDERKQLMKMIAKLRVTQENGSEILRSKMQNSLCLLRHFSRMA